jgi:flagellin
MGLRINQNVAAMNAYRNLSVNDGSMAKSLEKLSSGFRINRAADDAAGLSISEGLRAQTGGLKVAVRNAQDGISVVQTAEGALTETHSLLQRMRDLAVQAANTGGNDTDARTAIKTEADQITAEINRIGNATKYGQNNLLDGSTPNGLNFQIGSQSGLTNQLGINIADMRASALGLQGTGATLNSGTGSAGAQLTGVAATDGTDFGTVSIDNGTGTVTSKAVAVNSTADTRTAAGRAQFQDDVQKSYDTAFGAGVVRATVGQGATGTDYTLKLETVSTTVGTKLTTGTTAAGVSAGNNTAAGGSTQSISDLILAGDPAAIDGIDKAISSVSGQRAKLGAYQNRLEHTINNLNVAVENLSASESRIRDTDMAQEMVSFTRSQILSQAGTSMLAQANQAPQSVSPRWWPAVPRTSILKDTVHVVSSRVPTSRVVDGSRRG